MNADGSGQRNLTRNAANALAPAWSPDGRKIVFERGPEDRLRTRPATATAAATTSTSSTPTAAESGTDAAARQPLWSPDGQKIAFTSKRENWAEIYVMNADGSGQQSLTRSPARTVERNGKLACLVTRAEEIGANRGRHEHW